MTGMKKYLIALAALALAGCGPQQDQFVDVKIAAERQARGELLLDVREADDYKEFHVPNSMNIPFGRLKLRLSELAAYKDKPIMVTDHAGVRAPRAWEELKKAGFTQVTILKGGVAAWREAGLPVATLAMQMEKDAQVQQELEMLEKELEQLRNK